MSTADNVIVRGENPEDYGQIRAVNEAAFGQPDEADLVDSLRLDGVRGKVRYADAFGLT